MCILIDTGSVITQPKSIRATHAHTLTHMHTRTHTKYNTMRSKLSYYQNKVLILSNQSCNMMTKNVIS